MFKNNYIQKLAYDNIKKQKNLYRFVFIALVLSFFLTTISSVLFTSFEEIGYKERYERYGKWSAAIESITNEQIQIMNQNGFVDEVGMINDIGNATYQNKDAGTLQSLDHTSIDLLSLQLKEGRMPTKKGEIAIEEDQMIALGISSQLNQEIKLTINGKDVHYLLVGIIDNYSQSYLIPLSSMMTYGETSSEKIALYNSQQNVSLWNMMIENGLDYATTYNTYTYIIIRQSPQDKFVETDYTTLVFTMLMFLGFSGVLGTMISVMGKREEHLILMRSIGATSKQIQKLIIYEGVMLAFIAMIIAVLLGILTSALFIYLYSLVMNSDFLLILDKRLLILLIITSISCLIAIFIPSNNVYHMPLTGKITQKIRFKKTRKVRRINILRLAIEEIYNNKFASCLLVGIMVIGLTSGLMSGQTIYYYIEDSQSINKMKNYDYILNNDYVENSQCLSTNDINDLTHIEGISSQVIHKQPIQMSFDGVEKNPNAGPVESLELYEQYPMILDGYIVYYENQDEFFDVLKKYNYQGQETFHDNEVLLFKPHFYINKNGLSSDICEDHESIETEYIDSGLDVGDQIQVISYVDNHREQQTVLKKPFKIVETVSFDQIDYKYQKLFETEYLLIVSKETYQKYFQEDFSQKLLFDVSDKQNIGLFKQKVLSLSKQNHFDYSDTLASTQILKTQMQEDFIKNIAFTGILFVGITILVYIQRKIYVISIGHNIGLYRAIGMTKKQIYEIYGIYSMIIYMLSLIMFMLLFILVMIWNSSDLIIDLIKIYSLISYIVLMFLFLFAVIFPIHCSLKENILKHITTD